MEKHKSDVKREKKLIGMNKKIT